MQFSEKLKQLRASKNISQAELAECIFVSRSAVAKWENGLGLPSDESLKYIADYFGVTVVELLSDPVTESVIVKQNSTLSQQKQWIIVLVVISSVLLMILLLLGALFLGRPTPTVPPTPAPPYTPVITRELIFDTEKEMNTSCFVNYPDDAISTNEYFASSRIFEVEKVLDEMCLPELVVKVTTDGEITYEKVDYSQIEITTSLGSPNIVYIKKEVFYSGKTQDTQLKLAYQGTQEEMLNAWVNFKYDGLILSIKVFKNKIPLESISVYFAEDSTCDKVGLTRSKQLTYGIYPRNAFCQECVYAIEKIVKPNGEQYEGDLSAYASIYEDKLLTTKDIELDSKIYITVTETHSNIKSKPFVVTVERVSAYNMQHNIHDISLGESKTIELTFEPFDATYNVLNEKPIITLLSPELATLENTDDGWVLTASNNYRDQHNLIELLIQIPECDGINCNVILSDFEFESVLLVNADTGEEPDEVIYMKRGESMRFTAIPTPQNIINYQTNYWSVTEENYEYNDFRVHVHFSNDGELKIDNTLPLYVDTFYVYAIVEGVSSKTYKVVVQP